MSSKKIKDEVDAASLDEDLVLIKWNRKTGDYSVSFSVYKSLTWGSIFQLMNSILEDLIKTKSPQELVQGNDSPEKPSEKMPWEN